MRFRTLLWLALFPPVAAWIAAGSGLQPESRAPKSALGAPGVPDAHDAARPAAVVAMQIVARLSGHQGGGGPGSIRPGPLSQSIRSLEVECTPVRLTALGKSHAAAAHGGPLIYFPTAPPVHG